MGNGVSRVNSEENIWILKHRDRTLFLDLPICSKPKSGFTFTEMKDSGGDRSTTVAWDDESWSCPTSMSRSKGTESRGFKVTSTISYPQSQYATTSSPRFLEPSTEITFRKNHCAWLCRINSKFEDESQITLLDDNGVPTEIPPFRRWQVFPGNTRFYFDGWLMTGPDRWTFYLSFFLMNLVFGLFAFLVIPHMAVTRLKWASIPVIAFLYFTCVSTMLYSALTDPGIVPRGTRQEVKNYQEKHPAESGVYPSGVQPFIRETVGDMEIIRRWCNTCHVYKPPRGTHCRICNNCVERFDHHCPFLGNCVGQRNYISFFIFVLGIVVSGIFVTSVCIVDISIKSWNKSAAVAFKQWPVIITTITTVLAATSCIAVAVLLGMHIKLMALELTTNEDLKRIFKSGNNPYDRGTVWKNYKSVLCAPRLPSLIYPSRIATKDWLHSLHHFNSVKDALLARFRSLEPSPTSRSEQEPEQDAVETEETSAGTEDDPTTSFVTQQAMAKASSTNREGSGFLLIHRKGAPEVASNPVNQQFLHEGGEGDVIVDPFRVIVHRSSKLISSRNEEKSGEVEKSTSSRILGLERESNPYFQPDDVV